MNHPTKHKMLISTIILLCTIVAMHHTDTIYAYTVRMYNRSSTTYKDSEVHVHNTAAWCPDSRNEGDLIAKTGDYIDDYKSIRCGHTCFDYFEVKDQKFYIPDQCSSPTIEIFDDAIYLNGKIPKPYDCWKAPGWAFELAAKKIALESAKFALQVAEGFLDKVGKPIGTTGALAVRETGKGVVNAGGQAAVAVIEATDEVVTALMEAVNIKNIHWDGSLTDLEKGSLGSLEIKGTVFKQNFDVKVDLDVTKPFDALKHVAENIVEKLEVAAKDLRKITP